MCGIFGWTPSAAYVRADIPAWHENVSLPWPPPTTGLGPLLASALSFFAGKDTIAQGN